MTKTLSAFSDELVHLIASVLPSTVTIWGDTKDLSTCGSGSGWVFDHKGHIVTNYHVIQGMENPVKVKPAGMPHVQGRVIGIDQTTDLAVLSVNVPNLSILSIREESARLGELCLAVGSPLGLRESASLGVISGLSRQSKHPDGHLIEEMLQTDASVNPGNSGGPLVDINGKLLGVNTLGVGETVNFAVPAETVSAIIPELINHGNVLRGSIGVSVASTWANIDGSPKELIEVRSVKSDTSPLRTGDLFVSIDAKPILKRADIQRALNRSTIDREVDVTVLREGKVKSLSLVPREKI